MKYKLTAAVIGSGFMGRTHAEVLKDAVENLIICSNDETNGKALAEKTGAKFYSDYITMLDSEKIDFVSVCLPTHLHHYGVTEAAKRKINVLCEKPFASTPEQAKDMVKTARDNGVLLMVAHPLRFNLYYEYLRKVVQDNRFGKPVSIDMYRHSSLPDWSVNSWLSDTSKSGGVLRDLHIHETDIITYIFGVPQKVYTRLNAGSCLSSLIYNDGTVISSAASWRNIKNMFNSGYDAVFENAVVHHSDKKLLLYVDDKITNPLETEEFSDIFGEDMYDNEIRYFCKCLTEGTLPHICMPEESAAVMEINTLEINTLEIKSAETGIVLEVNI